MKFRTISIQDIIYRLPLLGEPEKFHGYPPNFLGVQILPVIAAPMKRKLNHHESNSSCSIFPFSHAALARPFSIDVRNSHEIFLRGPSCEALKNEVAAIQEWTNSRQEFPETLEIDCDDTPELIEIEITSILPKLVNEVYGTSPYCDGPNCWNWSLVESKLNSTLRYVDDEEWKFYLKTYCKIRDIEHNEWVHSADIAAIRRRNDAGEVNEVHGFISVDKMACTKNGYSRRSPYLMVPTEEVFDVYGVSQFPECRIGLIHPPSRCKTYVNYYQCSKEQGKSLEGIRDYQDLVTQLENSHLLSDLALSVEMKKKFDSPLMRQKLVELKTAYFTSREVKQLRDAIVVSLREQMSMIEDSSYYEYTAGN